MAANLEKVLPEIIHENQCAYVKGSIIFDGVRSIDDVMEYTKLYNYQVSNKIRIRLAHKSSSEFFFLGSAKDF